MPAPFDPQWSDAWADGWLAWFEARLGEDPAAEFFAPPHAPLALLVLVGRALERRQLRMTAEADAPGAYVLHPYGVSCEGTELTLLCDPRGVRIITLGETPEIAVSIEAPLRR